MMSLLVGAWMAVAISNWTTSFTTTGRSELDVVIRHHPDSEKKILQVEQCEGLSFSP